MYDNNLNTSNQSLAKLEYILENDIGITNGHQFQIKKREKIEILNALLIYYRSMIPNFRIPKSYAVVRDIFA